MKISGLYLKLKERLNIHNLKTKLIVSIFTFLLIFITAVVMNNLVVSWIIREKTDNTVVNSTRQANVYLTYVFNKMKDIAKDFSTQLYQREDIRSYINPDDAMRASAYMQWKSIDELGEAAMYRTATNRELDSIYIYCNTWKSLILPDFGAFSDDFTKDFEWMKTIKSGGDDVFRWVELLQVEELMVKNLIRNMISLICRSDMIVREIRSEVYLGINISEPKIYEILKEIRITQGTMVFLLNSEGRIISTSVKEQIGKNLRDVYGIDISKVLDNKLKNVRIDKLGTFQKVFYKNETTGWYITVLIPEKELFLEQRIFWTVILTILVILSLIMAFFAYRTIVEYVDKPVEKLVKYMMYAEEGVFDKRLQEERMDEFGFLYRSYNKMVEKIRLLIRDLYHEKLLKKEIELKHLQKQINPHFLYNTLDTINWLAKTNRTDEVSQIVVALSGLYRNAFNKGRDYIAVGEAINDVENYLYIQKLRFGELFTYHLDIDDRVNSYLMLNLLVQPFVENALIHGIARRDGNGEIRISAQMEDNLIHFLISDSGLGMHEEQLKLLLSSLNFHKDSYDSGFRNTYHRVKLFYGDKYNVSITSSHGKGTQVEMYIPVFEYLDTGKTDNTPGI